jgi:hypothetical protein
MKNRLTYANIQMKHDTCIFETFEKPWIFKRIKTNLKYNFSISVVRQDYLLQPSEFCQKYKLLPPQLFTIKQNRKEIFTKLTTMAAFP